MFLNPAILLLPLALLGVVLANPVDVEARVEATAVAIKDAKTPSSVSPLTSLSSEKIKGPAPTVNGITGSTTTPNSGFHSLSASLEDSFVFCTADGCGGQCYAFPISSIQYGVCYTTNPPFLSWYVYQASNTGLPFGIYVGLGQCSSAVFTPYVNTCYHTNPLRYNYSFFRYP